MLSNFELYLYLRRASIAVFIGDRLDTSASCNSDETRLISHIKPYNGHCSYYGSSIKA